MIFWNIYTPETVISMKTLYIETSTSFKNKMFSYPELPYFTTKFCLWNDNYHLSEKIKRWKQ